MELLFYWIKEDKTFKEELFKFSNRYIVSVDFKNDSYTVKIDENEGYTPNFYGQHINSITAIVGENGSGKTNLLYDLISFFTGYQYRFGKSYIIGLKSTNGEISIFETISKRDGFSLENNTLLKATKTYVEGEELFDKSPTFTPPQIDDLGIIYFNPIYDFRDYPYNIESRDFADVSSTYLLWADSKEDLGKDVDRVRQHRSEEIKRQFRISKSKRIPNSYFDEISLPDKLEITLKNPVNISIRSLDTLDRNIIDQFKKLTWSIINSTKERDKSRNIKREQSHLKLEAKLLMTLFLFDHLFKALASRNYHEDFFDFKIIQEKIKKASEIESFESLYSLFIEITRSQDEIFFQDISSKIDSIFHLIDEKAEVDKHNEIVYIFPYEEAYQFINNIEDIVYEMNEGKYINCLSVKWRNISSGELAFLNLFSRIMKGFIELQEEGYRMDETPPTNILLILDEGEHAMHPNWQKKYLNLIINFLEVLSGIKFQLLITTHSPIMLSDMPKSDITFLEKQKSGVTLVKSSESREQTFGANIYSLYKDSFFMKDGFIGEFAMSKINKLFKRIDELDNPSNEIIIEIKKQIDLIGEPILRNTLLNKLRETLPVQDQIEELSREIERLKNLKNGKN